MNSTSRSFFISAALKSLDVRNNMERHLRLRDKLRELGHTFNKVEAIGTYNNVPELTFIVSGDNNTEEEIVLLAKEFQQECIMIVYGKDSVAELVYTKDVHLDAINWDIKDGTRQVIGKMVCKGSDPILNGKDYTFSQDLYYCVE